MDIEFRSVSRAFDGQAVLEGFSAVFPEGRISALTGPSGRGKTTLLRLLSGELKPDSGTISGLAGRRVSMVFQEDRLVDVLSVRDNLAMTLPRARWEEIEPGLDDLGLSGSAPRQAGKLSGGMKRRVAILRAMLAPFDLLLLDEPFKGLDREIMETCAQYMKEKVRGKTVVLVTHDEREARLLGAENWIGL
jgi:NitT/TauT family transport system ATP-binding protein